MVRARQLVLGLGVVVGLVLLMNMSVSAVDPATANLQKGLAFLKEKQTEDGVQCTDEGLCYKVILGVREGGREKARV